MRVRQGYINEDRRGHKGSSGDALSTTGVLRKCKTQSPGHSARPHQEAGSDSYPGPSLAML